MPELGILNCFPSKLNLFGNYFGSMKNIYLFMGNLNFWVLKPSRF